MPQRGIQLAEAVILQYHITIKCTSLEVSLKLLRNLMIYCNMTMLLAHSQWLRQMEMENTVIIQDLMRQTTLMLQWKMSLITIAVHLIKEPESQIKAQAKRLAIPPCPQRKDNLKLIRTKINPIRKKSRKDWAHQLLFLCTTHSSSRMLMRASINTITQWRKESMETIQSWNNLC